jgi:hypothetical protein
VPYQHRQRIGSNEVWLWATARFCGLPGEEFPTDLACQQELAVEYWGRPPDAKLTTFYDPYYRRGATRLLLQRAVHCQFATDDDSQCGSAYLLDYSPLGCRLRMPSEVGASLNCENTYTLHLPAGLPWPWQRDLSPRPRKASITPIPGRIPLGNDCAHDVAPLSVRKHPLVDGRHVEVPFRFVNSSGRVP